MDFSRFLGLPLAITVLALGAACTTDEDPATETAGSDGTGTTGPGTGNGPGTNPNDETADGNTVDPDSTGTDGPDGLGGECPQGERVGTFDVILEESYSAINGEVRASLVQTTIVTEQAAEAGCRLLTSENPFCDPPCGGGQVCTADAQCDVFPERIQVGTVNITGLVVPIALEPAADSRYFETDLPHPAITPGVPIELTADGLDLAGFGFGALAGVTPSLYVAPSTPIEVSWDPEDAEAHVRIELNIDQHGISPATLFCDVPDTGSFSVPADLVDALLASGVSGFPSSNIYRQTIDSTNGPTGCVELRIRARTETAVEVEGHTACNVPEDCPPGQTCNLVIQTCE